VKLVLLQNRVDFCVTNVPSYSPNETHCGPLADFNVSMSSPTHLSLFLVLQFLLLSSAALYWVLAVSLLRLLLILSPKDPSGGWLLL